MPPIYSVVSSVTCSKLIQSIILLLSSISLIFSNLHKYDNFPCCQCDDAQEMDAADFKGLVSDHWHVGVVGTTVLPKPLILAALLH